MPKGRWQHSAGGIEAIVAASKQRDKPADVKGRWQFCALLSNPAPGQARERAIASRR